MTDATSPYRASDEQASATLQMCPNCEGGGEIGTRQDYFGNWDTEQCRCCDGEGEITSERAAEWRALLEDYS